ncbi:MAG: hypothetical protein D8B52_05065 [Prevotella sp.]|jgi:hypothetical protein|nr:MAG: hypothetical protein D8B52_05065 [Prevotella sp.]
MSANRYDKEIFKVLTEAGVEGLSVQKIARHVFNSCNSFFEVITFEEVHAYVSRFLLSNSKKPNSIIERTAYRGVYHLNFNSRQTQQLMLQFIEEIEENTSEPVKEEETRSLFQ